MVWHMSYRADPVANQIAKRHYTCQSPTSDQFVPPGRCLVLLADNHRAYWVTSWPLANYVKHAWAGAWICSAFRNEGAGLSSQLIREAIAATRWYWPDVPTLGMVTFVNQDKVRRKRDPGRCYLRAGFHYCRDENGEKRTTQGGLVALEILPDEMPAPEPPIGAQLSLTAV